ncbi:MAG: 4Fe-4S dicluster domain-containing protein [Candidatus Aminicenantales bacterium]
MLLLYPLRCRPIEITGTQERIDERDTIFARFDVEEKSESFSSYYSRRPELRDIDEKIRRLPDIFSPPHLEKSPLLQRLAQAEFDVLENLITHVSGEKKREKIELTPEVNTEFIKKTLRYLGAQAFGIASLEKPYIYSHVGRGPEQYGKRIELNHSYAVVFALEMELAMIRAAPSAPVIVETGKKYLEGATISIIVAQLIRLMGYEARAHIAGSNYQVLLPPLGWLAGLGEVGRIGILITWKFGPRARLGVVTTNLPLIANKPQVFGIQNFCQKCLKCALNCPARAIPDSEKKEENGVLKWTLNREECYRYWRKAGTDCAICISVCPYSKPDNLLHNSIRELTRVSRVFQSVSIWGDDFFYGRRPLRRKETGSLDIDLTDNM